LIISCTIEKKDELIPNEEFYSQLWKLNKEQCVIFDDFMYRKRMHPNQPIHLFLTRGANNGKKFTLLLLIHGFLRHYNRKLGTNPLKQKVILMVYTSKVTFTNGTTIHSWLNLPLNCKHLQSLLAKRFNSLSKTYDGLQLRWSFSYR
jgi:hypothetical protein